MNETGTGTLATSKYPKPPHCWAHPTAAAVARCQRCNLALCDRCFRLFADRQPVCELCALELSTGPPSRWPFAIAFVGATVAICAGAARVQMPDPSWGLWGITIVVSMAIAIGIGLSTPKRAPAPQAEITEREAELEMSSALLRRATSPYRARVARVSRRVVPLSGRSTALVMCAAFAVSGVALPVGLKLPLWIELELVLASWWLCIFLLLTVLLYRDRRLTDDHRLRFGAATAAVTSAHSAPDESKPAQHRPAKVGWGDLGAGCGEAAGLGEGLVVVIVLAVALSAAWALVELVLPVVFFLVYYFVVKAIGRVARDQHRCKGRIGASLGWGAVWSLIYVAPVALVIWGVHAIIVLRQH